MYHWGPRWIPEKEYEQIQRNIEIKTRSYESASRVVKDKQKAVDAELREYNRYNSASYTSSEARAQQYRAEAVRKAREELADAQEVAAKVQGEIPRPDWDYSLEVIRIDTELIPK
jgi:hypothetical protein